MEDGLEDYMIPCLIIQPLVENAVNTGNAQGIRRSFVGQRSARSGGNGYYSI